MPIREPTYKNGALYDFILFAMLNFLKNSEKKLLWLEDIIVKKKFFSPK